MLAINEDLLGLEAIADPYTYYGRLREEDPLHWNPLYAMWVLTRYDDVVWALRHPEVFSSEIFLRDPHPPLPPILETDQALYDFNKHYLSHWFLRRDAPDCAISHHDRHCADGAHDRPGLVVHAVRVHRDRAADREDVG